MRAAQTVTELAGFAGRGAGTDAERRAATWLRSRLEAAGREARVEPFWSRPNTALAHAWHVGLGIAGSLVSVSSPRVGAALVLLALMSVVADSVTGRSPGRRLTPERASQNVVATAPEDDGRVRLIITANYDAGRTGLVFGHRPRAAAARLHSATGRLSPGWLGWLVIALGWLVVTALLRLGGARGAPVGVAQLVPTVGLVLAFAGLLELGTAPFGPAAGDNASGIAAVLALARALDLAPAARISVEFVLAGAGEAGGIGLRRYLRGRTREIGRANSVVLGIAACGSGRPRWWVSDGALVPLRYLPRLSELCAGVAGAETHLDAAPHRGRGATPALPARHAGLPAITIGCLDGRGLVPRSHQDADTVAGVDPEALEATLAFALAVVDAIDAELAASDPDFRPG